MGPRPQCYIPSHKVIGPLVVEMKIFEGFLPYMDMAAVLVMWPRLREQTFARRTNNGRTDDGRTTDHGYTISSPMSLKAQVS